MIISFKQAAVKYLVNLQHEEYMTIEANDAHMVMNEMRPGSVKGIDPNDKRLSAKLQEIGIPHCAFRMKERAIEIMIPTELNDEAGHFRAKAFSLIASHCTDCVDRYSPKSKSIYGRGTDLTNLDFKNVKNASDFAKKVNASDIDMSKMTLVHKSQGQTFEEVAESIRNSKPSDLEMPVKNGIGWKL